MPCEHRVSGGSIQTEVAKRTMAARAIAMPFFSLPRRIGSKLFAARCRNGYPRGQIHVRPRVGQTRTARRRPRLDRRSALQTAGRFSNGAMAGRRSFTQWPATPTRPKRSKDRRDNRNVALNFVTVSEGGGPASGIFCDGAGSAAPNCRSRKGLLRSEESDEIDIKGIP
jgi:hypothetical protein